MNRNDPNLPVLQAVARQLGPLREKVVLVGGCAVGLLITDNGRPPVRATTDVDLVVEVASRISYHELTKRLRALGFSQPVGDLICRWNIDDMSVDILPCDGAILGFENRWYRDVMEHAVSMRLPSGQLIRVASAPLLIATKIEAFHGRGAKDCRASHDIEDIVNLIDGRPELPEEIGSQPAALRDYLREELADLLEFGGLIEALPWHLAPEHSEQARIPGLIGTLRRMAGL